MTAIGAGRVNGSASANAPRAFKGTPASAASTPESPDPVVIPFCLPDPRDATAQPQHDSAPQGVPAAFTRSAYGATRRVNPLAMLGSAGAMLAIVATLATLQMTGTTPAPARLSVVTIDTLDTTPPPPPPPAPAPQTQAKSALAPPSVPKPMITLPSPGPVRIALDAPPPPV
ncbi:hypothetical protein MTR62_20740, partial [Novosphingobium sp. 1949]|nr:hypothetical protein [Novosphingobium organovorum]